MTTRRAAGRGSRVCGREPWTMPRGHRGRPTEMCLADDAVLTFSIRHILESRHTFRYENADAACRVRLSTAHPPAATARLARCSSAGSSRPATTAGSPRPYLPRDARCRFGTRRCSFGTRSPRERRTPTDPGVEQAPMHGGVRVTSTSAGAKTAGRSVYKPCPGRLVPGPGVGLVGDLLCGD
jgi:hypothetical protein